MNTTTLMWVAGAALFFGAQATVVWLLARWLHHGGRPNIPPRATPR